MLPKCCCRLILLEKIFGHSEQGYSFFLTKIGDIVFSFELDIEDFSFGNISFEENSLLHVVNLKDFSGKENDLFWESNEESKPACVVDVNVGLVTEDDVGEWDFIES